MPDPIALMIVSLDGQNQSVALTADVDNLGTGKVIGLYTKDQLAPSKVPLIDQHDQFVGYEFRRPDFYLNAEGYRDEDDVIWTQPTAEAYAKVCALNHFHRDRVAQMMAAIAEAADLLRGYERHHRAKADGTFTGAGGGSKHDASAKAERNRVMAEKLERLIDPSWIVPPGGVADLVAPTFGPGNPDIVCEPKADEIRTHLG